ncbi:MAG: polysaccharide biosynthesis C-terminal domain-containing protein, partial [Planctomycetes bacterium]|nr:polysaccharide biosynthesis C-terminal domain-containing protein [Planctomycetota bacterium]
AGAMAAIAIFALAGAGAATTLIDDALAVELLLILVFLTPLESLDRVLIGLLGVLGASRAIFWRRHVLAPALKLGVVGILIAAGGDARFLAAGYLAAAAIGVLICGMAVSSTLGRRGLRNRIGQERMEVPWRELLAFTAPLLASDLVLALMSGADVLFLAWFADSEAIASYRAVLPVAHLNHIVIATFAILYTPQAARLYSRGDGAALNELYWKTAGWIAVLSLPVFLVSVPLAGPLTTLLFGQRYAGSAEILMLLSLGSFFHAALGFNGTTLTVYRRVRYVMLLSFAAAAVNIGLNLWLIPRHGALGAAAATCASMLVHNVLKQAGLRSTGVRLMDPRAVRLYAWIAFVSGGLFAAHRLMTVPPAVSVGLAAAGFVIVLRVNRRLLDIDDTFPELRRLPLIARLVR